MASSPERPQPPITFEYPVQIEVRRAEFELLASVPYLDLDKLARSARAEIELGYYKTDSSCRHFIRAIVEEGMVTELLVEPCSAEETEPASPELVRLFNIARENVSSPEGEPFRPPVPVSDFMPNAVAMSIRIIVCIEICMFQFCYTCCSVPNSAEVMCGKVYIDETRR
jgi:hypothetical protein